MLQSIEALADMASDDSKELWILGNLIDDTERTLVSNSFHPDLNKVDFNYYVDSEVMWGVRMRMENGRKETPDEFLVESRKFKLHHYAAQPKETIVAPRSEEERLAVNRYIARVRGFLGLSREEGLSRGYVFA